MYRFFHVRLLVFWTSTNRSAEWVLSVPFRRCHFEECVTKRLGWRAKPLTTPLTTAAPHESTVQPRWLIMFSQGKSKHKIQQKNMFREYSYMSQLLAYHCPHGYLVQTTHTIYIYVCMCVCVCVCGVCVVCVCVCVCVYIYIYIQYNIYIHTHTHT